ncbi:MAG: hypothetical protein ER33_05235 [Cyanobium sp. CACIAM 14]|nr:MAG: hypothetical protein ER33_05235 [Cyanobium sp. CACIAM 14]
MSQTSSTARDQPAIDAEIASLKSQLDEARDEAELNRLQLQQVQEELEFYFLAHQELHQLLERHRQEERRAEVLIAALLERIEATSS